MRKVGPITMNTAASSGASDGSSSEGRYSVTSPSSIESRLSMNISTGSRPSGSTARSTVPYTTKLGYESSRASTLRRHFAGTAPSGSAHSATPFSAPAHSTASARNSSIPGAPPSPDARASTLTPAILPPSRIREDTPAP